jgi:hypothetical protein
LRRIISALLPSVALLAALTPIAHAADPKPITSPYTQATAVVGVNGELLEAKNVVSSSRSQKGVYCVKVNDGIDLEKSTILTTPYHANSVTYRKPPQAACGNDPQSIGVYVFDTSGALTDQRFTVAVL